MDVITLRYQICKLILMHGVISHADATSCEKTGFPITIFFTWLPKTTTGVFYLPKQQFFLTAYGAYANSAYPHQTGLIRVSNVSPRNDLLRLEICLQMCITFLLK